MLTVKGYNGAPCDIWSCGVILFVLMAGYSPFDEENLIELYRRVSLIFLVKKPMHGGELTGSKSWSSSSINKDNILFASGKPQGTWMKEVSSGLSSQHTSQSSLAVTRKKRVQSQVNFHFSTYFYIFLV